jgi:hypothetical protein
MQTDAPQSLLPFRVPARVAPVVVMTIVGALVGYPMARQLRRGGTVLPRTSPEREALILNPDSADAYNNLGASYAALGLRDPAIDNALHALRIRPDYALAQSNLAWALNQKRLRGADAGSP